MDQNESQTKNFNKSAKQISPELLDGMNRLLRAALWSGDHQNACDLLKKGADPNGVIDNVPLVMTAYESASQGRSNSQYPILDAFVQHGVNLDVMHGGETLLMRNLTDEVLLEHLLKNGADPGVTDSQGNTALHFLAGKRASLTGETMRKLTALFAKYLPDPAAPVPAKNVPTTVAVTDEIKLPPRNNAQGAKGDNNRKSFKS